MAEYILGGYTNTINKGINTISISEEGKSSNFLTLREMSYPTYIEYDKEAGYIFSIDRNKQKEGGLSVFRINNRQLEWIDTCINSEVAGCHICYDNRNKKIFVSQYHTSKIDIYDLQENQLKPIEGIARSGSSVRKEQTRSRPHCVVLRDDLLYICDLGTDHVAVYLNDESKRYPLLNEISLSAGSGPRHLILSEKSPRAYVIGELNNTLQVISLDNHGLLKEVENVYDLVPDRFKETAHSAAIKMTNDEKYIYTSSRYHDVINVFKINHSGQLEQVQRIESGGLTPRDFTLSRDENYLLVPNLDSNNLVIFERSRETGKLTEISRSTVVPECSRIIAL
ncbi:hypothetical protein CL176_02610 [Suicoccus acidiformans]|uniref:6-phosphogluconolactonase n=1 Tax=Suicoccus acidiformans TaxID=2036206 RepID=A0A347WIU7_9LACT|nr:lactonase family protein [Suicoccus acidiformans]AXY25004.1 hypothetical protein CL176_02610 [Suicoccus acidiformans]